jgi:DNA repair photolyase
MNEKKKPIFGTKEWAKYNENFINGCSHDCRYCYAKEMAVRFRRKTADSWKQETIDEKKLNKRFSRKEGRFMFPTSHDITPDNLVHVISFLGNILKYGNDVLIVSKPHLECIRNICDTFHQHKQNILFRFSIGSADNQTLKFWDQYAPSFDERLESIIYAHKAGFQTSISSEPMLDDKADILINKVMPYVTDAIWFGKMNRVNLRLKMNGHGDEATMKKARQLMDSLSDDYILNFYSMHKDNARIKWKESIKKVGGIEIPLESGLDI